MDTIESILDFVDKGFRFAPLKTEVISSVDPSSLSPVELHTLLKPAKVPIWRGSIAELLLMSDKEFYEVVEKYGDFEKRAWAWIIPEEYVVIDLDYDKFTSAGYTPEKLEDLLRAYGLLEVAYIERTVTQGFHIVLRKEEPTKVYAFPEFYLGDIKQGGNGIKQVTLAPNKFRVKYQGRTYTYKYLHLNEVQLWETATVEEVADSLEALFGPVKSWDTTGKYWVMPKEMVEIEPIFDGSFFTGDPLIDLGIIGIAFVIAGCDFGRLVLDFVEALEKGNDFQLNRVLDPITGRSSWFHFEHVILGAGYLLGTASSQLAEFTKSLNDLVDEVFPDREMVFRPAQNPLYNVLRGTLTIIPYGSCPFMATNVYPHPCTSPCSYNPIYHLFKLKSKRKQETFFASLEVLQGVGSRG